MASRKQKKPRIPRAKRAAPVTEKTLGESIIEQMQVMNALLADIRTALTERNQMLSVVTSETAKQTVSIAQAAAAVAGPAEDTTEHSTLPVETPAEPVKRKRGRPSKAELAARAAEALAKGDTDTTREIEASSGVTAADHFPKMCACGVREDVPKHLHAKGCPVHFPAEPVPAHRAPDLTGGDALAQDIAIAHADKVASPPVPAPTIDDVRATAITFIGKHGKEKFSAMLEKFGVEKISSVPAERLGELLADLQKAG